MSSMEPSLFPQSQFTDDGKDSASLKDSTSTFATASMSLSAAGAASNSSSSSNSAATGNPAVEDISLRDSSLFSVEKSCRKKKKKKDNGGKSEKKGNKKKRKSKSSSNDKSPASASSSSLRMDGFQLPPPPACLSPGANENELFKSEPGWKSDYIFDSDAAWGVSASNKPKHQSATNNRQQNAFDLPKREQAPWPQGQHEVPSASVESSNFTGKTSAMTIAAAQVPNSMVRPADQGRSTSSFAAYDLDLFLDENVSALGNDGQHLPTVFRTKDERQDMMAAAKQAMSARTGNGDANEVPSALIIKYMMAMGANRGAAEEVASSFQSEQQIQDGTAMLPKNTSIVAPATANRYMQQLPTATFSNKQREAERAQNTTLFQRGRSDLQDPSDYISNPIVPTPSQQSTSRHPTTEPVSKAVHSHAKIIEATPVDDDIESDTPFVYAADVEPITLKSLINDHPLYFLFCLGLLAVAGIVVGVLYITILDAAVTNGNGPSSTFEMQAPTMTPSLAPTFISNDILLAAAKLSGVDTLSDPRSPQFKAVAWMSSFDESGTGGMGRQDFAQRYALTVMYFSFHGEEWIHQENWLAPDQHECEWSSGVLCDSDSLVVKHFDATRNNLQGTIPPEIGLFASIESFHIPKNSIRGTIPGAIGKLTMLSIVDASDNQLTGPIPPSFAGAQDLNVVNLSNNQLTSTIPVEFYSLKLLRTLMLTKNDLSGTLPDTLVGLSSLVTLDLRQNRFSGTLPMVLMDDIKNLDFLLLDHNRLTGPLPPITNGLTLKHTLSASHNQLLGNFVLDPSYQFTNELADLQLTYVDVSYNLLTGPINQLLGLLPTLRHFDVSGNRFAGPFPSSVGFDNIEFLALKNNLLTGNVPVGYPSLTHLDVSSNFFTQGVPEALCDYPDLEFLFLSGNQLESTIPACLGAVMGLRDLELGSCSLTGTIPSVFGQLSDLSILDLSGNVLSSTIPTELGNLAIVQHLKLQDNMLTGSIPSDMGRLVDLKSLNLTGNILTGMVPLELGGLEKLESLLLQDNTNLRGEIPSGLCSLSTLEVLAGDIGCSITCGCCNDTESVCNSN